jgi:hypothetical protein
MLIFRYFLRQGDEEQCKKELNELFDILKVTMYVLPVINDLDILRHVHSSEFMRNEAIPKIRCFTQFYERSIRIYSSHNHF